MIPLSETVDQLERVQKQLLRLLRNENSKESQAFDVLRIENFNLELREIREEMAELTRKVERWLFKQGIDRRVNIDRRGIERRRAS